MNKLSSLFTGTVAIVILAGCAAPPSPAEREARWLSTLNVQSDNRVVLRTEQRRTGAEQWSWSSNKDTIVAVEIDGRLYNAKEIARITSKKSERGWENVTVHFRNGEKKSAEAGYHSSGYFGPAWVACNEKKKCSHKTMFSESMNEFGGHLASIQDSVLNASSFKRDPRFEIRADNASVPRSGYFEQVLILDDKGRETFEKRLADLDRRWKDQKPVLENARVEQAAQVVARENVQLASASAIGQINCSTTVQLCRGSYDMETPIACGDIKTSVGAMMSSGWVIANVNTEFHTRRLGEMCDYNIYHLSFKK